MLNDNSNFLSNLSKNPLLEGILSGFGMKTSSINKLDRFFFDKFDKKGSLISDDNDIGIYFYSVANYMSSSVDQYGKQTKQT